MKNNYDLIVIGSGPGGYVAAIRASQLGLKTLVIEKDKLGGICLNWGCIPTKALLKSADVNHTLSEIDNYGISLKNHSFNWKKIIKRSRGISKTLSEGVKFLLKKNKIDVIYGHGKLAGSGRVIVKNNDDESVLYEAPNIILATGARPKNMKGLEVDNINIWNYKDAMIPDKMPNTLLVIGAGAIGVEFASFYNDFGVKVTLVESQNNILPSEDYDVSSFIKTDFEKRGIEILNNTKILKLESIKNQVKVQMEVSENKVSEVKFSKAIVAVGIDPNIDDLGIDTVNINIEHNKIVTNVYGETSEKGIYAIGDISGAPWLAHKASHEGISCVENIVNEPSHTDENIIIPSCIYSRPQVASVGITEEMAIKNKVPYTIGKFPMIGNGKALATGDNNGFVKTIFNKESGELLGAHMVGPEVTELISIYSLAIKLEATELDLMSTIFPHPTISESLHESVLAAYNKAIHI
ncbi:MAG: dihydrolipoyl dehydrogenase [Pelagibacterales bacterium]|nr:dihydrolipoyl dehydrogenase [Pelagibacterales bacterium]|tara:strand:- start:915 stop:2312 length:1398 start_codon:yes stop_codon:yes gene_type:complete